MPVIPATELRTLVNGIFLAAKCPENVSQLVTDSLVASNLVGHDSHGVIRVPAYMERIRSGELDPHGAITTARESASTALLDCGRNFGQFAARRAMDVAIAKARQHDVGVVVTSRSGHTGRLGEYAVMAAEQGMIGLVFCSGTVPGGQVAPFGGIGRALGANPIAWGIPGGKGRPIFMDFATSIVAQGKIQVAIDKGEEVPLGWILDKEGRPTTHPRDHGAGGVLLPFGGHKGYGISVMIELITGGLSGLGTTLLRAPGAGREQGMVYMAVNISAFQPLDEFNRQVDAFVEQLKKTPCAEGVEEILLPGEPEWRCRAQREQKGIPLPDGTWKRIQAIVPHGIQG